MKARRVMGAVMTAALAVSTLALTVATATPAAVAPTLAPGFRRVAIPTGMPDFQLTNFVFLPSGEMLVAGTCGHLRRIDQSGAGINLPSIPVNCIGDRGLLGIDIAPDYISSGIVY